MCNGHFFLMVSSGPHFSKSCFIALGSRLIGMFVSYPTNREESYVVGGCCSFWILPAGPAPHASD